MNKDLYVCIKDYQGGNGMMELTDNEKSTMRKETFIELYNTLKTLPQKYVIDYINDIWQIEIVKVKDETKDNIIKYIADKSSEFSYYNMLINETIHKLDTKDEYIEEKKATLENLKEFINKLESEIYEVQ